MEQCHIGYNYNLLFSVINDNSIGKLPEVALKTSSTKSYLSLVSFFSFPRLNNLELRASLCKILISSFAHKMDFAHNLSVDFF